MDVTSGLAKENSCCDIKLPKAKIPYNTAADSIPSSKFLAVISFMRSTEPEKTIDKAVKSVAAILIDNQKLSSLTENVRYQKINARNIVNKTCLSDGVGFIILRPLYKMDNKRPSKSNSPN